MKYLERDLPLLGFPIPAQAKRRFWTMLAHYHAQTWNGSELARAMGLSDKTLRGYLDLLTGTYMVRQLLPWYENLGKRQVKAPRMGSSILERQQAPLGSSGIQDPEPGAPGEVESELRCQDPQELLPRQFPHLGPLVPDHGEAMIAQVGPRFRRTALGCDGLHD